MERGEPTLVPEWLKVPIGGGTASANSYHHTTGSSSHSDDIPRSSAFPDRSSSSFRRSSSSNGSVSHDKDSSAYSRPYSSFGRSHRDRDREKDLDFRDRDRFTLADNGYHDSYTASRTEKDTLRRSQSMISGRRVESRPKRAGNDANNSVLSGGGVISGISKASFERDFPSLGADEKQWLPDIGRVSSPGLTSVQSLPIGTSAIIGGDGWTSALAEVPAIYGGNGSVLSSSLQTAPVSPASTTPSTMTGLNMAETLAQAPLRVRTVPQLSVETQRLEELAIKQSRQLIPMTPSMPKSSVLSSSEKPKSKGARGGDFSVLPKVVQQSSSQLVNHTLRGPARSDILKTSQPGNFQVLNRERNGISPTIKDSPSPTIANRIANALGVAPSVTIPHLKNPINPKPKADSKGSSLPSTQISFGEKRSLSQAKNRNDFFNTLRKKTSMNHSSATPEPISGASSPSSEKMGEQVSVAPVSPDKGSTASNCCLDRSMENGGVTGNCDACPDIFITVNGEKNSDSDTVAVPNEEEAAFLRSLGWEENGREEALTAEEIDGFVKKIEKKKLSSELCPRERRALNAVLPESRVGGIVSGGSSGLNSSSSEPEV